MSDAPATPPSGDSFLTNKVSGIKLKYLLIFGLVVGIGAYLWRKRKAQANPVVPPMVDTSGAAGGPAPLSSSDGGSGGIGNPTPPVPQTNAQWARAALNAAIGNGTVDATDGANAVSAFLNGQPLTAAQANIMAKLTSAYGQPPEGVLPIILTPVVTATPTPTPTPAAPAAPAAPAPAAPAGVAYPLDGGSYFGPRAGGANSISGYYNHRSDLQTWQQQMANRGWAITPDGLYGPQTAGVARAFQQQQGLQVDALIGPQTWAAAWR